jgi:AraC family carnitine catabolism transcriptional activator
LRGRALADEVANALLHTGREGEQRQRPGDSPGRVVPGFQRALIAMMEQNLDFPLAARELARRLGLSPRTLERRCRRNFGQSPGQLYLSVRLQAARNLLFYEELSVKEIATACGFSYPTAFARSFARHFGASPRRFRARFRDQQKSTLRPEISRLMRQPRYI